MVINSAIYKSFELAKGILAIPAWAGLLHKLYPVMTDVDLPQDLVMETFGAVL